MVPDAVNGGAAVAPVPDCTVSLPEEDPVNVRPDVLIVPVGVTAFIVVFTAATPLPVYVPPSMKYPDGFGRLTVVVVPSVFVTVTPEVPSAACHPGSAELLILIWTARYGGCPIVYVHAAPPQVHDR